MKKNIFTDIPKTYSKMSDFGKALVFIVLLLMLISFFNAIKKATYKEGFTQQDEYVYIDDLSLFDGFYSQIYDSLVFNQVKNDFEVGQILELTDANDEIVLLDVGCGTGHHVNSFSNNKRVKEVVGIDNSQAMINMNKEKYPNGTWVKGDVLDLNNFKNQSFTHITCLYFTIYYFKDKRKFFENCMEWLMPGGYLVVHMVDKDKFDPILPPGNPLYVVSPQKYAKERITTTQVTFNDFQYSSNFNMESDESGVAEFDEKFKFKNGKTRHQKHKLYMEDEDVISATAQECGFTIHAIIDMIKCAYEQQYLYVFVKP